MKAILDLPIINKTSYTLRNLTDDFQTLIQALQDLANQSILGTQFLYKYLL